MYLRIQWLFWFSMLNSGRVRHCDCCLEQKKGGMDQTMGVKHSHLGMPTGKKNNTMGPWSDILRIQPSILDGPNGPIKTRVINGFQVYKYHYMNISNLSKAVNKNTIKTVTSQGRYTSGLPNPTTLCFRDVMFFGGSRRLPCCLGLRAIGSLDVSSLLWRFWTRRSGPLGPI